jgi:hypothetical protein
VQLLSECRAEDQYRVVGDDDRGHHQQEDHDAAVTAGDQEAVPDPGASLRPGLRAHPDSQQNQGGVLQPRAEVGGDAAEEVPAEAAVAPQDMPWGPSCLVNAPDAELLPNSLNGDLTHCARRKPRRAWCCA